MKVLTIGGAMIDTIALVDDERIERMAMSNARSSYLLLEEGKKIEAAEVTHHCGGGAINTAVCFARLSHETQTCVVLGDDKRADTILDKLEDEEVSGQWIRREAQASTGASIIIASHERDAAVFTYRGANTYLDVDDLNSEMFSVDLTYIASLSNESADSFRPIIVMAKQVGSKVAANPGIRQLTSRTEEFFKALPDIDILFLNRTEACALVPALVGRGTKTTTAATEQEDLEGLELLKRGLSFAGHDLGLISFLQALQINGATGVVVTDGKRGAYYFENGQLHYCPAQQAEVAGTAGAGDAYAATFASLLLNEQDPLRAMRAAAANASSVISFVDTQTGLLNNDALNKRTKAEDADQQCQTFELK